MDNRYFYEPHKGHGLAHDPLNAIVAPRPIGWVSTVSAAGQRNLAPYSFFNLFNYRPPIIGFSSVTAKDSLANARATGEFVWNLATFDLKDQLNRTSATVDPGTDEFELADLASAPSRLVGPDRVAASPVSFECKVSDIVQLRSSGGTALEAWLVLGEVVGVHIDPAMLQDGIYITERARPIMRGGGPADYFEALPESKFLMRRPD